MKNQDLALLDTLCSQLSHKIGADGVLVIALSVTEGLMFASEMNSSAEAYMAEALQFVAADLATRRASTEGRPN